MIVHNWTNTIGIATLITINPRFRGAVFASCWFLFARKVLVSFVDFFFVLFSGFASDWFFVLVS